MKIWLLILGFLIVANASIAQDSIRKNSIMVESNFVITLSISYDRIVPIKEKVAVIFGVEYLMGIGFGHGSHWLIPEVSLLSFGPKHFLETGVQYAIGINPISEGDADNSPGIRLAYRFQSNKGFTVRATANVLFDIDPILIPAIGLGYSF